MESSRITEVICRHEILKKNKVCPSVKYLFSDFECDILSYSKIRTLVEFEIKISRSDFFRDFKKSRKHELYQKGQTCPNKLYYVVPKGLVTADEIPYENYGLIYVSEDESIEVIRQAKLLTKNKLSEYTILSKFLSLYQERCYFNGNTVFTVKRRKK